MVSEPLCGVRVHCTGVDMKLRPQLLERLQALGAEILLGMDKDNMPDILIARTSVKSDKYQLAVQHNVPVVQQAWATKCYEERTKVDVQQFLLSPLAGVTISLTGFDGQAKQRLALQIEGGGGRHSPELTQQCTHLIAATATGEKFKYGTRWGLPVVTVGWLQDSLASGVAKLTAPYAMRSPSGKCLEAPALLDTQNKARESASGPGDGCDNTGSEHRPSISVSMSKAHSSSICVGTACSADVLHDEGACRGRQPPGTGPGGFLRSNRLYLAGFEPNSRERYHLRAICQHSGAKLHRELHSLLGYVIVGPSLDAKGLAALQQYYESSQDTCCLVSANWLLDCDEQRTLVVPSRMHLLTASHISSKAQLTKVLVERGCCAPAAKSHSSVPSRLNSGSSQKKQIFKDMWFTAAALDQCNDPSNAQSARELLRSMGAHMFSASTCYLGAHRAAANHRYALCPNSLPPARCTELAASRPDFKMVVETNRVTVRWVRDCCDSGKMLPMKYAALLYRPVPYILPIAAMQHIRLCASLYDEGAKKYLIEVAHLLGACFTDALKPSNTHLLVPRAAGAKWSRAAGMGVIPVVAGWLTDTMAHGILQDTAKYAPELPTEEDLAADPGLAQVLAATGAVAGESEVPLTQRGIANSHKAVPNAAVPADSRMATKVEREPGLQTNHDAVPPERLCEDARPVALTDCKPDDAGQEQSEHTANDAPQTLATVSTESVQPAAQNVQQQQHQQQQQQRQQQQQQQDLPQPRLRPKTKSLMEQHAEQISAEAAARRARRSNGVSTQGNTDTTAPRATVADENTAPGTVSAVASDGGNKSFAPAVNEKEALRERTRSLRQAVSASQSSSSGVRGRANLLPPPARFSQRMPPDGAGQCAEHSAASPATAAHTPASNSAKESSPGTPEITGRLPSAVQVAPPATASVPQPEATGPQEAGTETLEWDRLEEALQANKTRSHQTLDATQQETLPLMLMPPEAPSLSRKQNSCASNDDEGSRGSHGSRGSGDGRKRSRRGDITAADSVRQRVLRSNSLLQGNEQHSFGTDCSQQIGYDMMTTIPPMRKAQRPRADDEQRKKKLADLIAGRGR